MAFDLIREDLESEFPSFEKTLEQRARRILAGSSRNIGPFSLTSFIKDEIALTVHQIDRLRERGKDIRQNLLQSECYIGSELMQMEERTPRYSPYRFPEREKLQRRLGRIAEERRRFVISHAEKIATLHDRLLSLLNRHGQLEPMGVA